MNNIDLFIAGFRSLDIDDDAIQITWRKHALNGARLDIQLTWNRFIELYPDHTIRDAGKGTFQIAEVNIGDVCILSVAPDTNNR